MKIQIFYKQILRYLRIELPSNLVILWWSVGEMCSGGKGMNPGDGNLLDLMLLY